VVVPDQQLSLAIGKEGQNARLAAKLTGWRSDIKSASDAEAEKLAEANLLAEAEEETGVGEELPAEILTTADSTLTSAELAEEAAEPLSALEAVPFEPLESQAAIEKPQLRFAEDILVSVPTKPEAKPKKKKKKGNQGKKSADDGVRLRRLRRDSEIDMDIGDEEY
jgi:N utilization substance protein A